MSFEYLADPARPAWAGLLPGKPEAYFLSKGEGEHAKLFADTFSVLLSGDETDGQFGIFTATVRPATSSPPTRTTTPTRRSSSSTARSGCSSSCPMAKRCRGCSRRATSASFPRACCTRTGSSRRRRCWASRAAASSGSSSRWAPPTDTIDPDSPPFVPDFPRMQAAAQSPPHAVPARLHLARCLTTRPLRMYRCYRQHTLCRCLRHWLRSRVFGWSRACRTRRSRGSGRWNSTSTCRPERLHPFLLSVFLHGGGWRVGSRHSVGPAYAGWSPSPFERLAQAKIAVASVDYRLSGEAQWPAQLYDAKAAVRWLRARADEIGIDPSRIAAWGESAGGHLAALLGLTGPDLDGEIGITGPSSAVVAVAAWYAPSDLATVAADTWRRPDGRRLPRSPAGRRTAADRARTASAKRARSATYAPARRRSCCCMGATTTSSRARRVSVCAKRWCRRGTPSSSRPTPGPTTCGEAHRLQRPTHWNALSTFCGGCLRCKPTTVSAGRYAGLRITSRRRSFDGPVRQARVSRQAVSRW